MLQIFVSLGCIVYVVRLLAATCANCRHLNKHAIARWAWDVRNKLKKMSFSRAWLRRARWTPVTWLEHCIHPVRMFPAVLLAAAAPDVTPGARSARVTCRPVDGWMHMWDLIVMHEAYILLQRAGRALYLNKSEAWQDVFEERTPWLIFQLPSYKIIGGRERRKSQGKKLQIIRINEEWKEERKTQGRNR